MPDSINELCNDGIWWVQHGNLGYDQGQRWSWEQSGYKTGTEVDCSSFVIGLLRKHGFEVGSVTYTGDMSANLTRHGWKRVANNGAPQKGDILLNDVHHVALYVGDGKLIQASRGEAGHRVSGGAAGDQDDYETNLRSYYDYPWDCYLRYTGATSSSSSTSTTSGVIDVDGWWCTKTTRALQELLGIKPDGVISGQPSVNRPLLKTATYGWEWVPEEDAGGSLTIMCMQQIWGADPDGLMGPESIHDMLVYYGIKPDGELSGPSLAVKAMQRSINAKTL